MLHPWLYILRTSTVPSNPAPSCEAHALHYVLVIFVSYHRSEASNGGLYIGISGSNDICCKSCQPSGNEYSPLCSTSTHFRLKLNVRDRPSHTMKFESCLIWMVRCSTVSAWIELKTMPTLFSLFLCFCTQLADTTCNMLQHNHCVWKLNVYIYHMCTSNCRYYHGYWSHTWIHTVCGGKALKTVCWASQSIKLKTTCPPHTQCIP